MNDTAFKDAMEYEMREAQRDYNRAISRQIEWRSKHPLPPPTRRQRLKTKLWWVQRDARQTTAQHIAPWLNDD
jgi:hypothetical protein